jgi:hypothetical protein
LHALQKREREECNEGFGISNKVRRTSSRRKKKKVQHLEKYEKKMDYKRE